MTATRPLPPPPPPAVVKALEEAGVPIEHYADACRACDACDEDVDPYPKGFEQDMDSEMLGGIQAFGRQVLVSTGKSDWPHDISEDQQGLPYLIQSAYEDLNKADSGSGGSGLLGKLTGKLFGGGGGGKAAAAALPGVYPSSAAPPPDVEVSSRLSILASSFISSSHSPTHHSTIILPDYKIVHEVSPSRSDAEDLAKRYLLPSVGRAGAPAQGEVSEKKMQSWPLPYHAVVLLCSHKKRDKRCHISAPLLISQFHHHLSSHGFHIDERGDGHDLTSHGPPIEDWEGTTEEKEERLRETLQEVGREGEATVGVFKVSHLGGHKFAGNVIIYFPNGSVVWYGRASPADVKLIVDRTIVHGQVIPELLRGGLGLEGKKGGERGVLEW
ncbi:hypothetical protein JCM11251_003466 [Rhodosporidiobolus azoricus]